MSVAGRLAGALGRNDERPNVELAEALAAKPSKAAVDELTALLSAGTTAQQNDALKVLYELGARKPELIAPHLPAFLALLKSKNNRNVWGALQAVDAVVAEDPKVVFKALSDILGAADKGSVIARDKAMSILSQLASAGYGKAALPVFLDRLEASAPNQFPMYAEFGAPVIDAGHRSRFVAIIEARLPKLPPAKQARLGKLLRKLSKSS
jgi:hypothetical protein